MISSDYTKEVGMPSSQQKKVPLPYVIVLIAILVAAGWYGFVKASPAKHHESDAEPKKTSGLVVSSPSALT
jgi:hypothetical protein